MSKPPGRDHRPLDWSEFKAALNKIFDGVDQLRKACGNRRNFTVDGRLVGDLGEIVAEAAYDIVLDEVQRADHDAITPGGRLVQVKATFQEKLTFGKTPDLYLGLKLNRDGTFEEVFNGPGGIVAEILKDRKGFGTKLLPISIKRLRRLPPSGDRVPVRHPSIN